MKKGFIVAVPIQSPKQYDPIIWFKEGIWCIGSVTGEGVDGKTRVSIGGSNYETHTNTLKTLVLTDEKNVVSSRLHEGDWQYAIDNGLINAYKEVDFSIGEEYFCSYPSRCECSQYGNVSVIGCDHGYAKPVATITGLIDKDYSEDEMIRFSMFMAMNYSEVLNSENYFWYRKQFDHWKNVNKPKNCKL